MQQARNAFPVKIRAFKFHENAISRFSSQDITGRKLLEPAQRTKYYIAHVQSRHKTCLLQDYWLHEYREN